MKIKTLFLVTISSLTLTGYARAAERPDILLADFEGDDLRRLENDRRGVRQGAGAWHAAQPDARHRFPGQGAGQQLLRRRQIDRHADLAVRSRSNGSYLNFLIGGGKHPGKTCMNLLVDGKVVRTATGPNDRPGGSERLAWHTWDVAEFAGKKARLQIVDNATGGWGHINVDHIVQSDREGPRNRLAAN